MVLLTHELESLKAAFPFIQTALADLTNEVTIGGDSKQMDFKIGPEVSCSIKSSGLGTEEINVYRLVQSAIDQVGVKSIIWT